MCQRCWCTWDSPQVSGTRCRSGSPGRFWLSALQGSLQATSQCHATTPSQPYRWPGTTDKARQNMVGVWDEMYVRNQVVCSIHYLPQIIINNRALATHSCSPWAQQCAAWLPFWWQWVCVGCLRPSWKAQWYRSSSPSGSRYASKNFLK